jgi:hypothetical protein
MANRISIRSLPKFLGKNRQTCKKRNDKTDASCSAAERGREPAVRDKATGFLVSSGVVSFFVNQFLSPENDWSPLRLSAESFICYRGLNFGQIVIFGSLIKDERSSPDFGL